MLIAKIDCFWPFLFAPLLLVCLIFLFFFLCSIGDEISCSPGWSCLLVYLRITLNLWSSCPHYSALGLHVYPPCQVYAVLGNVEPGLYAARQVLPTLPHLQPGLWILHKEEYLSQSRYWTPGIPAFRKWRQEGYIAKSCLKRKFDKNHKQI